jgi:putative (di)nucleoside polyphosphate hydrolase
MIDEAGYRPNVGIILLNKDNLVFWGRRKGEHSWQFPQGGLAENESLDQCMYRELNEELGLLQKHVTIIDKTKDWLYYDVPGTWAKQNSNYRGQKQIWYLLRFIAYDHDINLRHHRNQEFDAWRWVPYWDPIDMVVKFKQNVYTQALNYLAAHVYPLPA